ncbi:MAG: UDP-N-acetylmuramoyl-L-alanyl-D-glutamate--2,6-diaminopimelate ligase [Anaerolineae bacterium]
MTSDLSLRADAPLTLAEVVAAIEGAIVHVPAGTDPALVAGVSHNSAWVTPGDAFVAIAGQSHDGHTFVPGAVENGAVAIIGEDSARLPIALEELRVPYVQVADARRALAALAARLAGYPSESLTTVGVTGTKGKTTTAWLIRHLLAFAGHPTGLLSTLGYKLCDDSLHQFPAHFTTPEAPQAQATLQRIVDCGGTHAVVEASSEALAQHRLHGTTFDVAVWTNLAPEHLNFHGDMEGYFRAKRILFDQSAFAVLNAADPYGMRLTDRDHVTYACEAGVEADWEAHGVVEEGGTLRFKVRGPQTAFTAMLPLIGSYNVPNALAAIAVAAHLGIEGPTIREGLAAFPGVPGRMQILKASPVRVVLDFAHTPDSLEVALQSLRQTTERCLVVILGSAGGPRDPSKRAPLGAVATELADLAVFTEEDCRDTPIYDILNEMKRGADKAGRDNYRLIPDRREAIRWALRATEPGDTVVFCGKAGETTLERADETLIWDEETEVRKAMHELGWSKESGQ